MAIGLFNDQLGGLEARAAAVFATDTGHNAFLPGAELGSEPPLAQRSPSNWL